MTESITTTGFHRRALGWLRDEMRLSTPVVPSDRNAEPTEPMRVPGAFARPSRASTLGLTGLWVLSVGLVLSMLGMPGISPATKQAVQQLGLLGELLGAGLLLAGVVTAWRHRDHALVELRPAAAGPATAGSITALQHDAGDAITWMVAERGFEAAALDAATKLGVRCFVPSQRGFAEIAPAAST